MATLETTVSEQTVMSPMLATLLLSRCAQAGWENSAILHLCPLLAGGVDE